MSVVLSDFAKTQEHEFLKELDLETERIRRQLPKGAQYWGVSRKVLNIFLRNCLYNTYLNKHYKLERCEEFLEIPLDSISAKEIIRHIGQQENLRWLGVKNVTREINREFQDSAKVIAIERKTSRVHLDANFWGGRAVE